MKKALLTTLTCLLIGGGLSAAMAFDIPNFFSPGEQISSADVNENFDAIADELANKGTPITQADLPLVIAEGGKYYLAENLTFVDDGVAIFIAVPETNAGAPVHIDFNGHALTCTGGAQVDQTGILSPLLLPTAELSPVTIENGSIESCSNSAIRLVQNSVSIVRNMIIFSNIEGSDGINVSGRVELTSNKIRLGGVVPGKSIILSQSSRGIVQDNIVSPRSANGAVGIDSDSSKFIVKNNVVDGNTTGIDCAGCLLIDNLVD